ncbi:MAG: DUF1194 domain-containing protein [Acetobacteraceae bacterium]
MTPPGQQIPIDVALVLAIDVSGSMSEQRLRLQLQGYIDAFRSEDLARAVRQGPRGLIAATLVEWSDYGRQEQTVGWMLVADRASGRHFANAVASSTLAGPGWTSLGGAIRFSSGLFAQSGFRSARKVIDISGDGVNNDGPPPGVFRDRAVAAGITINGLPIVELDPGLAAYYRTNVIGGPDSFVEVAADLDSFAAALLRKLIVEVSGRQAGPAFG